MLNDRIREKLLSLQTMAERGTENEALNAMILLNRLCLKYGIEQESLGQSATDYHIHTLCSGKMLPNWKKVLCQAAAMGVGAYVYSDGDPEGNRRLNVAGRAYQITVVAAQFDYLVLCADRLAHSHSGRSAKNAFKLGFASRIFDRIQEENDPQIHPEYGAGLMVLHHSTDQIREYIHSLLGEGTRRRSRAIYSDATAYDRGYEAGGKVGLNRQISTGRHLTGGS